MNKDELKATLLDLLENDDKFREEVCELIAYDMQLEIQKIDRP